MTRRDDVVAAAPARVWAGAGGPAGRTVLVAGVGISGLAAAAALQTAGASVLLSDDDPDRLAAAVTRLRMADGGVGGVDAGTVPVAGWDDPAGVPPGTELVITSPGRRPDHPLVAAASAAGTVVVGEPELAWWLARGSTSPAPWLVVTGTNGKTTTTGMLAAVLAAAGRRTTACGNIGLPVVAAVPPVAGRASDYDVLAVELSSFQLHWSPSVRPAAGCVLNVADDHLDWHGSRAAYAAAKARALTGAVAVAGVDDPAAAALLAHAPAARRVGVTLGVPAVGQVGVCDGELVDRAFGAAGTAVALAGVGDVTPAGEPGLLDALAAAALARAHGVEPAAVRAGLLDYRPGPHRGGRVATIDAVAYLDDSKATNPHAAAAALRAAAAAVAPTGGRVVWIVGGLLKGATLDEVVAGHAALLRAAVVIGRDRAPVGAALARHAPEVPVVEVSAGDDGPMAAVSSVPDAGQDPASLVHEGPAVLAAAVRRAQRLARPGDVVLLAPAAASMDQFRDYAQRGEAFAAAVTALGADGVGSAAGASGAGGGWCGE